MTPCARARLRPTALILVALLVGTAIGLYPADVVNFSGFQETLDAQLEAIGQASLPIPVGLLVAAQFVNVLIGSIINAAAGFSLVFIMAGESFDPLQATILGWSGWLVPLLLVTVLAVAGQFRVPVTEAASVTDAE